MQVVNGQNQVVRKDPMQDNTKDFMYEQIAAITLDENKHGGGDVGVYASGQFLEYTSTLVLKYFIDRLRG